MALSERFHEVADQVRNWGRWGDDDEIGTLNLITPEVRRAAAAAVRSGKAFSLALPLDEEQGIQVGVIPGRDNPIHRMTLVNEPMSADAGAACTSDDRVDLSLQAATHWDGLCHVSYDGRIYNGYPADGIDEAGAGRCGIHRITSLTTRGVLLDVARVKGLDVLEQGYPITAADLDAAEELAGTAVRAGDVVLVRTGAQIHLPDDKWAYTLAGTGLTMETAPWFHDRDVAAVATDTITFEVYPFEGGVDLAVHLLHLVEMGMTQGQNWVLDELAADCADDGQYDFLLEASPLPFVRAVGSPVNPVAVK
ncbi:MAG TPA: cyclase family protein [Acidimicrobiales bacterium]|nr:cyclase family protein [Acidimicrobiales bacterium]